jgi:hypothetical protein
MMMMDTLRRPRMSKTCVCVYVSVAPMQVTEKSVANQRRSFAASF